MMTCGVAQVGVASEAAAIAHHPAMHATATMATTASLCLYGEIDDPANSISAPWRLLAKRRDRSERVLATGLAPNSR